MTGRDTLRGWQSSRGWRLIEGVIHAPKHEAATTSDTLPHHLWYQRPLLAGEAVNYEFFYEPKLSEISPTLGRVAFLIQPEGVRIRWITQTDHDWTGLLPDNAVTEPLNRRGPRPLPLKAKEWNRVTLARTEQAVTLSLNGEVVYQRTVDWSGDMPFGFYHDHTVADAQVRNVVMTGDWPQSVPQEFFDNPLATRGQPPAASHRLALNKLFHEPYLAENALAIRRRALAMPVAERFQFLSRWILPGPDHSGFRVSGDFTATRPAPPAREPAVAHPELGGQIVSPVFDWIDAARELGRFAECRQRVQGASVPDDEFQRRARAALLMLLDLEQGDAPAIAADAEILHSLLRDQMPASIEDQWPETLVVDRGARNFAQNDSVVDLISAIYAQRTQQFRPAGMDLWHSHIDITAATCCDPESESLTKLDPQRRTRVRPARVDSQSPQRSRSRAVKVSPILSGSAVITALSNYRDTATISCSFICRSGGDYEVGMRFDPARSFFPRSGDAGRTLFWMARGLQKHSMETWNLPYGRSQPGHRSTHHPYRNLGPFSGSRPEWDASDLSQRPTGAQSVNSRTWAARSVDRDPFLGPAAKQRAEPENRGASRCPGRCSAFGVERSDGMDQLSRRNNQWRWWSLGIPSRSGIERRDRRPSQPKSGRDVLHAGESLLRYQRPLVEDGSFEYDFYSEPGCFETHPALDRLAFLIEPTGVREHWITDGGHDRTGLPADNSTTVPANRRGPLPLPLKVRDWNHLKLSLRASTVSIKLNGQPIYERELGVQQNQPGPFGLFHYVDATESRVRNVVMRGDWPKTLPTLSSQELADHSVETLDAGVPRLTAVFSLQFSERWAPGKVLQNRILRPPA